MAIVRQLSNIPSSNYSDIIKNLRSLRVIMLKKLGTAAEEEKRAKNHLKVLTLKIHENQEKLENQKKLYSDLQKRRDVESKEQKAEITKLN